LGSGRAADADLEFAGSPWLGPLKSRTHYAGAKAPRGPAPLEVIRCAGLGSRPY